MSDKLIIAHCGLVCTDCGMYKKEKCLGCFGGKPMNSHCNIKHCAEQNHFTSCADCQQFIDLKKCGKLNNLISKFFSFIFHTNRIANLDRIRQIGYEQFKKENIQLPK